MKKRVASGRRQTDEVVRAMVMRKCAKPDSNEAMAASPPRAAHWLASVIILGRSQGRHLSELRESQIGRECH
jgi:hypothetical protein